MTPIAFTLTEADVIAAGRLGMIATNRKNAVKTVVATIGMAAIVAAVIAAFDWDGWVDLAILFGALILVYTLLVLLFSVLTYAFYLPYKSRKGYRQIAALGREQTLSWTDTGFEAKSSQGESRFPFEEIHHWAANDRSIILYPADSLYFAFPTRVFDMVQRNDFIATLEASSAKRL